MRTDEEFARRLQRLDWDCRRGMMESEVLILPFRHDRFAQLKRADQEAFLDLLDCNDADLFTWFTSNERPPAPQLVRIIDLVLAHAGHRA